MKVQYIINLYIKDTAIHNTNKNLKFFKVRATITYGTKNVITATVNYG